MLFQVWSTKYKYMLIITNSTNLYVCNRCLIHCVAEIMNYEEFNFDHKIGVIGILWYDTSYYLFFFFPIIYFGKYKHCSFLTSRAMKHITYSLN